MPDKVDLIVKNGRVVTSTSDGRADIAISGGKFVAIAAQGELRLDAKETYDADGKVVIPGVIDGHVHFREPGFEYKEDWRTGSTAAVHGGVTMVIDMPSDSGEKLSPSRFGMPRSAGFLMSTGRLRTCSVPKSSDFSRASSRPRRPTSPTPALSV